MIITPGCQVNIYKQSSVDYWLPRNHFSTSLHTGGMTCQMTLLLLLISMVLYVMMTNVLIILGSDCLDCSAKATVKTLSNFIKIINQIILLYHMSQPNGSQTIHGTLRAQESKLATDIYRL